MTWNIVFCLKLCPPFFGIDAAEMKNIAYFNDIPGVVGQKKVIYAQWHILRLQDFKSQC
jgi:hypothetical protein